MSRNPYSLAFCLILTSTAGYAGVIRHDDVDGNASNNDADGIANNGLDDALYRALANQTQFDAAVRLSTPGLPGPTTGLCSAVLVAPDWILTAGHCVISRQDTADPNPGQLVDNRLGAFTVTDRFGVQRTSAQAIVHPLWLQNIDPMATIDIDAESNALDAGFDFALIQLSAVSFIEPALRNSTPLTSSHTSGDDDVVTLVGYGRFGTGQVGDVLPSGTRRAGENVIDDFDGDGGDVGSDTYPSNNHILMDFDNDGSAGTRGLDSPRVLEYHGASGDSGGPWFGDPETGGLNTRLVAIHSFARDEVRNSDTSSLKFAGYGDISGAGRVDLVNDWINSTIGGVNWNSRDLNTEFHNRYAWGDGLVPDDGDDVRFSVPRLDDSVPRIVFNADAAVGAMVVEFGPHEFDTTSYGLTAAGNLTVDRDGHMIFARGFLNALSRIRVGRDSTGTFEQRGGHVLTANNLSIGENGDSDGRYQLVSGTLSVENSPIEVGRSGNGELIQEGGTINAPLMYIGRLTDSDGTFRNLGGHTEIDGALDVGGDGKGVMRVHSGALVSNVNGTIGVGGDSDGSVTVTGADAVWTNQGFLKVGESGKGELNIFFGGRVSNTLGYLGLNSDSRGTALVTGTGSTWTNSRDLTIGGDERGDLIISAGGKVLCDDGFVGVGTMSNGAVTVTGPDSLWSAGSIFVGGSREPGGMGELKVGNGGSVAVEADLKIWPNGTVNFSGGTLTAPVLDLTEGTFNMSGGRLATHVVLGDLAIAGGTLAPRDSDGYTVIDGNYVQTGGAILEIGIGGTTIPAHDHLNIGGSSTLGGLLQISLLDGFVPDAASAFVILNSMEGLSGSFNNIAHGSRLLTADGLGSFLVNYGSQSTYGANSVVLSNFAQPLIPGDYDGDGDVNGADLAVWEESFGVGLQGDGNGDGVTDGADFLFWQRQLGATAPGNPTAPVPEPAGLALALASIMALRRVRHPA
jgi:T5SS/PEP-CTERM-associated repeat protein